jgi:hypothetical protein
VAESQSEHRLVPSNHPVTQVSRRGHAATGPGHRGPAAAESADRTQIAVALPVGAESADPKRSSADVALAVVQSKQRPRVNLPRPALRSGELKTAQ